MTMILTQENYQMGSSKPELKAKVISAIIKRMEEPNRPSITLGRADINYVLPILKKEVE
jgi:hypothetical protein